MEIYIDGVEYEGIVDRFTMTKAKFIPPSPHRNYIGNLEQDMIELTIRFYEPSSIRMVLDWFHEAANICTTSSSKKTIVTLDNSHQYRNCYPKSMSMNEDNGSIIVEFSVDYFSNLSLEYLREFKLKYLLNDRIKA